VCPRHRWQFDLQQDGRCTTNGELVHAVLKPCSAHPALSVTCHSESTMEPAVKDGRS
jgi:nitrite reductase/ring-hydroxylating ferredoxin subunit